jgi:hypothetical protein
VTRLCAGRPGLDCRQWKWREFSFRHRVQTGSAAHPDSSLVKLRPLFQGVKSLRHGTERSPESSVEDKNTWSYTSASPIRLPVLRARTVRSDFGLLVLRGRVHGQLPQATCVNTCHALQNVAWSAHLMRRFSVPPDKYRSMTTSSSPVHHHHHAIRRR